MKKINETLLIENIERSIHADLSAGRILGANAYVCQDGRELLKKSYGYADVEKTRELRADSVFRMASMTKPITAVAALREVEKGKLDLFDPVDAYIPEYRDMQIGTLENEELKIVGNAVNKPRILHLLTHSSGIGCGPLGVYLAGRMPAEENETLERAVLYYAKQPLSFDPYTKTMYSPTAAFDVLARIVEIVSGKDFATYVKTEICDPLGMTDTTFTPNAEQIARMVDMHTFDGQKIGKQQIPEGCVFRDIPVTHYCGGAGLASTLNDYINFALMLQNRGKWNGERILRQSTVRSMTISHVPEAVIDSGKQSWSLGMRTITSEKYQILPVGSFGWSGAYGTHFYIDPVNKITAIYLKNSVYDGGSGALTARHFEEDIYRSYAESPEI